MQWSDIKTKTEKELRALILQERAQVVDMRFKVSSGALKQVHEVRQARKRIAQMLTRLRQLAAGAPRTSSESEHHS